MGAIKYKNGQRVKLDLSTHPCSIYFDYGNVDGEQEGIVVGDTNQQSLEIKLINPNSLRTHWWIQNKYLQLVSQKGEQLLFSFMEDD